MSISKNPDGSYQINTRKPGVEAAAFGGGFAPDINGDGGFGGLDGGIEVTSGGLLTYAIYTAVMTGLDTTPAVRAGVINRSEQRQIILDKTWETTSGAVPTIVILAAVLALCPWLAPVAGIAGFIGASVMTTRLVRAGIDALSDEQKQALRTKASEVGVDVPGLCDEDEPMPSFA